RECRLVEYPAQVVLGQRWAGDVDQRSQVVIDRVDAEEAIQFRKPGGPGKRLVGMGARHAVLEPVHFSAHGPTPPAVVGERPNMHAARRGRAAGTKVEGTGDKTARPRLVAHVPRSTGDDLVARLEREVAR